MELFSGWIRITHYVIMESEVKDNFESIFYIYVFELLLVFTQIIQVFITNIFLSQPILYYLWKADSAGYLVNNSLSHLKWTFVRVLPELSLMIRYHYILLPYAYYFSHCYLFITGTTLLAITCQTFHSCINQKKLQEFFLC